jgi:uncharacterized Fe-S cluster-containing radical SAM superfamily protein
MPVIDTEQYSARLRAQAIRPASRQLLISRIEGSGQEGDLTEPPNCGGYGRLRHFRLGTPAPWPPNPLPILPASYRLAIPAAEVMTAQVFQNAACNWRCWYCFVPFDLLSANEEKAGWLTSEQMVDLYLHETERPLIIDCSGGQPDLAPEWISWMMAALAARGLAESVYLWSDDNLSNDYFWRYLDRTDRERIASYALYGRVACFKGYNRTSFAFNTRAAAELFERQFELFGRLLRVGIDLYAYATFTSVDDAALAPDMSAFVDRLQEIHPSLPLRLVPLRIQEFGVVAPRVRDEHKRALAIQEEAVQAWNTELTSRFSENERITPMPLISLNG